MDGKNNDREFEQFLKENADNHRLYPADSVWESIHARLHPKKRWPLTALLLLAFTTGSITWFGPGERSIESVRRTDKVEAAASIAKQSDAPDFASDFTQELTSSEAETEVATLAKTDAFSVAPTEVPTESSPIPASQIEPPIEVIEAPAKTNNEGTAIAETAASVSTTAITPNEPSYPLSIESVTNSYQRQKHSPRFRWQLHFTPTVSYRSLKEDQKFIAQARMNLSAAPLAATTELSNVINHRPDLGMQLGLLGTYPLGKRLDLIAGLQFNVSKYDIKAFNYPTEVATIALVNAWGGPTAVTTVTSFRSNGFMSKASWLRNYYYSLSAPVGLEWRILGKKQNHWGFSTTVQPTYMVGNRSYIISMDYQNYAEVPYLINKWNLNVGLETYAKFSVGNTDFRVGPQVRYQLFSSFKKGYPVSEHLYDFGVKLGIMLGK
ncbi:MAG: hypothetical protein ACK4YZ_03470 [Bacteroidota bacterium]|jgi:hypothetical protein